MDVIEWLLGDDNPSVRYYTLVDLLDRGADELEVVDARKQIMETGIVPAILSSQQPGGYWGRPEDFYIRSKYFGTVWNLIILAQLGADGSDSRVISTCDFILEWSMDPESGGYAYYGSQKGGHHKKILPCLTGNVIWSLMTLGYRGDVRIEKGIDWMCEHARFDDGTTEPPSGWPYLMEKCWGRHTCHYGVVKMLKSLSALPPGRRADSVNRTIDACVEFILKHRIYRSSHDTDKTAMPEWLEFGYPRMWDTDILEVLHILADLGVRDPRMDDAISIIRSKMGPDGRWNNERSFNGRFAVNIERKGRPGKWVTYRAMSLLKKLEKMD